jgi:hypothetical protein
MYLVTYIIIYIILTSRYTQKKKEKKRKKKGKGTKKISFKIFFPIIYYENYKKKNLDHIFILQINKTKNSKNIFSLFILVTLSIPH